MKRKRIKQFDILEPKILNIDTATMDENVVCFCLISSYNLTGIQNMTIWKIRFLHQMMQEPLYYEHELNLMILESSTLSTRVQAFMN